jgi:hypothetical protein
VSAEGWEGGRAVVKAIACGQASGRMCPVRDGILTGTHMHARPCWVLGAWNAKVEAAVVKAIGWRRQASECTCPAFDGIFGMHMRAKPKAGCWGRKAWNANGRRRT